MLVQRAEEQTPVAVQLIENSQCSNSINEDDDSTIKTTGYYSLLGFRLFITSTRPLPSNNTIKSPYLRLSKPVPH